MTKAIWINDTLHDRVKTYAFNRREAIGTLTEALWVEHLNNAPAPSNEADQKPIIIEKKAPGRPAKIKWRMPHHETILLSKDFIPEKVPAIEGSTVIKLNYMVDENHLTPGDNATSVLMDIAGFYPNMPASEFISISPLIGLPAYIEVASNPFTPLNDLAVKILALMPGRESYSRELLFLLFRSGFSIKYIE